MDLDGAHENTQNTQTWVKLYDIMLDSFKGEGRCVTMDSAYMDDIMVQIGRHERKFNMVGTTSENQTRAELKEKKISMKEGTYESIIFQHDSEELVLAMWSDTNIVHTLLNFHSPNIVEDGLNRKRKVDGKRERAQTPVPCLEQNKDYSGTFHLIDKGNGVMRITTFRSNLTVTAGRRSWG